MKANVLLITLFTVVSLFTSISCSKDDKEEPTKEHITLDSPKLSVKTQSATSFTIVWDKVSNADKYVVYFDGKEKETKELEASFSQLQKDKEYLVKVKAVATIDGEKVESNWSEIKVLLKDFFEITSKLEDLNWTIKITPQDNERIYFFDVTNEKIFKEVDMDPEKMCKMMLVDYLNYNGGNKSATYDQIKKQGIQQKIYKLPAYQSNYYLIAACIDKDLNITSDVQMVSVTTGKGTSSDMTFKVEDLGVSQSSIKMRIIPSNNDPYGYMLVDTQNIEKMSPKELRTYIEESLGDKVKTYTGERTVLYEKNIKPSTNYTLLVFGWNKHTTTEVTRHNVTTPAAQTEEDMKFDFYSEVLGSTKIYVEVTPSNEHSLYFFSIAPKGIYEKYKDDLKSYFVNVICKSMKLTLKDYMQKFSSVGKAKERMTTEPSTQYVLFAFPIEFSGDDVIFYKHQVYDKIIETPADE